MALTQEEFESLPEEMQELVDPDLMDLPDEYYEPVKIGPTWQKDDDGNWLLPEHTLGWEIAGWCSKWLRGLDGPTWTFTLEQLRFVLWWYAIDERGKFIHRKGVMQRLKGHGKDPLAAVLCLVEFVGPCRFSHWGADGQPVAKSVPAALVQIAAVNQEQTRNTVRWFQHLASDEFIAHYGVTFGAEKSYAHGGKSELRAVTSSPRSLEGNQVTFAILNEALALDTPIPTPTGWTTMGDLEAGDTIYGSDGKPTVVTEAHPTQVGRRCFRVTLADGREVVASDGHLWQTRVTGSAAKPRIRTTVEMFEDGRKFSLPRAGVRESDPVDLPVDPYLLGLWLGDGSTGDCNIAVGYDDIDATRNELAKRGIETHTLRSHERCGRIGFSSRSGFGGNMGTDLAKRFRALPCFREKFIPDQYLFAGTEQRLELLRGLMDSDGCATRQGLALFSGRERLTHDVLTLVRSLGQQASIRFREDARCREGGDWKIAFTPEGINPFSLPRKAERITVKPQREWISIRSIEEVESVPVRCISVAAEDRLFLAGQGIVTHNTQHWLEGNKGHEMYTTIKLNADKNQGRYLSITNAYKPGEESVAERQRVEYNDLVEGRISHDPQLMYDSLEAQPKLPIHPLFLPRALEAVRGDSVWLDVPTMVTSMMDTSVPIARSIRMWLNRIVATEDQLFEEADYERVRLETGRIHPGETVVLGFDGGKTDDSTAIVALRVEDHTAQLIRLWEKPEGPAGKGWKIDTEAVDAAVREAMETYNVIGFYADLHPWESYIDAWNRDFGEDLIVKSSAKNAIAWDMRGSLKRSTAANEALVDAFHEGSIRIVHSANMRAHILNAHRRENNFGVSFGKESRESPRKVDAYAALMLAHECLRDYFAGKKPEEERTGMGWFL